MNLGFCCTYCSSMKDIMAKSYIALRFYFRSVEDRIAYSPTFLMQYTLPGIVWHGFRMSPVCRDNQLFLVFKSERPSCIDDANFVFQVLGLISRDENFFGEHRLRWLEIELYLSVLMTSHWGFTISSDCISLLAKASISLAVDILHVDNASE